MFEFMLPVSVSFLKACTAGAVAASIKPDKSEVDVPIHLWGG
jgi:hypothetical protein